MQLSEDVDNSSHVLLQLLGNVFFTLGVFDHVRSKNNHSN